MSQDTKGCFPRPRDSSGRDYRGPNVNLLEIHNARLEAENRELKKDNDVLRIKALKLEQKLALAHQALATGTIREEKLRQKLKDVQKTGRKDKK